MDFDNGLDLGLGLSCGDSSSKTPNPLNIPTDDGSNGNGNKALDNIKSFTHTAEQKQDAGIGNQRDDIARSQGSFFEMLSKGGNGKRAEADPDGKVSDTSNKRKIFFDEMNHQKRHELEIHHAGTQDKDKTPHISITTVDDSTADNEDVAESEVECSASKPSSNYVKTSINVIESQGSKTFDLSPENELKIGNLKYNAPYSVQAASVMNMPGYPVRNPVQMMPPANGDRPLTSTNIQMSYGYPPVQLPILTKDHTWGMVSRSHQTHPSNIVSGQVRRPGSSEANNGRGSQLVKDDRRQEEDDAAKRNVIDVKETAQPAIGVSHLGSAIRPGIAADISFGGSGSQPNLPWVSTTAPGPNGRTISGVTYRFSSNQIKVVCACHGSHLTPEEFVRHASEENGNPVTLGE